MPDNNRLPRYIFPPGVLLAIGASGTAVAGLAIRAIGVSVDAALWLPLLRLALKEKLWLRYSRRISNDHAATYSGVIEKRRGLTPGIFE
ncbi:hypothetical protein [Pseudomonas brassicacearum]|uniref:hypothetical protein n=1 Tax=Pseudomonas brassicacearum TaxID=930166 RepID=UPI003CFA102D